MFRALLLGLLVCLFSPSAGAQSLQEALQPHSKQIIKPSRRSIGAVIDALVVANPPALPQFFETWHDKKVRLRKADGLFFYVTGDGPYTLIDIETGAEVGSADKSELKKLKPNSGVRGLIRLALVQYQLLDPELTKRTAAVEAISRDGSASLLTQLQASISAEPDADLKARKIRLTVLLIARFADDPTERIAAINSLSSDISVKARATLNQILATKSHVAVQLPDGKNIAEVLQPPHDAYALLVAAKLARKAVDKAAIKAALIANISDGKVAGVAVEQLNTDAARLAAYEVLITQGIVPALISKAERDEIVEHHSFFTTYNEPNAAITDAAKVTMVSIQSKLGIHKLADVTLDAISLASIYFLAAIGLAITFGVMGVINMAHGEFIMMGAYTGYVVQQYVSDYTISILIALPLAFAVTFAAGVVMERLIIRHLYHRPLETLLATFGISIALQQLAKNIFGTQARPLTSPAWLDGALVFNDVVQISYVRIAIFVLALIFLVLILYILKRTRLGLEVRAVTQNPGMAASMGINPDRINMLTFGLGSGIAGIAGVAIGLYAKVTSEMGADYIVQSFMTVVVGGVGNVWGTLAGASLIGFLQKGIEWFNPSNTLAAQTYMILFIILFIQFRPKGIVALKGRAAGD